MNYYLINKKEQNIKKELDNLIEIELNKLKDKLLQFDKKHDLDTEEEIEDKIRNIEIELNYGIFKPEEIHICKTNYKLLTWQICENYTTEKDFIEFYNMDENEDKYYIEDECSEVFTLEELMEKIHWEGQEVKYLMCEFR